MDWFQARVGGMESRVPREYTVRAIPATFLIGPDGRVLAKNLKPEELEPAIAAALRNDKLFAAAATGRPARFPVVRSTYASDRNASRDWRRPPSVIALCDTDPSFGKDQPHDDRLRLLTASGSELWSHGGLAVCPTIGGGHAVAVDRARNRIYVGEIVADRITAFNLAGQKLWQIEQIPIGTLAIDPKRGTSGPAAAAGSTRGKPSSSTRKAAKSPTLPYEASDIAYSPHDDAFWLAGRQNPQAQPQRRRPLQKTGRRLVLQFRRIESGRRHGLDRRGGRIRTARRARTGCGISAPTVRCGTKSSWAITAFWPSPGHAKRGEAWITAYNKGIRRVSADGVPGPPLPVEGKSLSISPTSGEIWLANKDALLRLDPTGKVLAKSPFTKPCLQSWLEAW